MGVTLKLGLLIIVVQVFQILNSRLVSGLQLQIDLIENRAESITAPLQRTEVKSRQKRARFHNCVKPQVKRFHKSKNCQFNPCDPPRGKYFVMADPEDKKCYCYGKGGAMPIRKRGNHEWWKPLPNENADPNKKVKPDSSGQCICTIPKVVLDNRANAKTVYNDR